MLILKGYGLEARNYLAISSNRASSRNKEQGSYCFRRRIQSASKLLYPNHQDLNTQTIAVHNQIVHRYFLFAQILLVSSDRRACRQAGCCALQCKSNVVTLFFFRKVILFEEIADYGTLEICIEYGLIERTNKFI